MTSIYYEVLEYYFNCSVLFDITFKSYYILSALKMCYLSGQLACT